MIVGFKRMKIEIPGPKGNFDVSRILETSKCHSGHNGLGKQQSNPDCSRCLEIEAEFSSYPRSLFLRFVRYAAEDSATCMRFFVSAGSKTTRTRARKTLATRRNMLKE